MAPRGTSAVVVQRLNDEINKAIVSPDMGQRLRDAGVEPLALTVQMFKDFVRSDVKRWAELVRLSGAKIE